jgi:hypothetical protein
MSNNTQLLSRPIKSGCNFNALNPVVYRLRREDYQFSQINDDGGDAQIQIDGVDLTTYFEVDDVVFIEGLGQATVTASAFSGGNTLVTVDIVFTATAVGYINNLSKRTDYKIEVEVFDFETDQALAPRLVLSPNAAGEVRADISGIMRAFLYADWEEVALNEPEANTSKKVYIKYQEFYDVTYFDLVDDVASPIVCVFAFIPILLGSPPDFSRYAHGGNLLPYFIGDDSKKFLTRMFPALWRGYPFTLSFCFPDGVGPVDRRVRQYDSQGQELSDDLETLDPGSGDPTTDTVHRLDVGDIDPEAVRILVSLQQSAGPALTEELEVTVKDPCESPVLLWWKNTLGGDSFWLFDENQEYEFTYPGGRRVRRMTLFADNLSIQQWDSINELNSPSDVFALNIVDYEMSDVINKTHFRNDNQVYIINADATKTGVIVIISPNRTKTFYKKHAIEVTIELPEFFTV